MNEVQTCASDSIFLSSSSTSGCNTAVLPADAVINVQKSCDANFIALSSSGEYPGGTGIYYDVKNGRLLCFSSLAKSAFQNAGLLPAGGYVQTHYDDPASGDCIAEVRTSQHQTAGFYFFNLYNQKIASFPIDLNQTATMILSPAKNCFCAIATNSSGLNEIFLIDVSNTAPKKINLSNNGAIHLKVSTQASFSPSGRFLLYGACDDNGQLYDENHVMNWALYNLETQKTIRLKGNFVRFIQNDQAVILENQGVGHIFDCKTGADITSSTKLENWQKWEVRVDVNGNSNSGFTQSARLIPLFGGGSVQTPVQNTGAVFTSDEYLYYYSAGEKAITCYSTDNGERFTVPLDEAFLREIQAIDQTATRIVYYIGMSGDKRKLLLFYSTEPKPAGGNSGAEDPGAADSEIGFSDRDMTLLFLQVSSLAEMKDFVDLNKDLKLGGLYDPAVNPYKNIDRYYIVQGEGYTSLIQFSEANFALVAVEDYRDANVFFIFDGE